MVKKGNDKLTISVNKKVKDAYRRLCEEKGWQIGKQIELFMKKEVKENE
jgi:hypothetical protein